MRLTARRSVSYAGYKSRSVAASERMRRNRLTGGRAEHALVRLLLHQRRAFMRHAQDLPGRPDLVFVRQRVCVFCDGDFWHGRRWTTLRQALLRRHNAMYWVAKIEANRARDRRQRAELRRMGWRVLRLWETDILKNPAGAAAAVASKLKETPKK